MTRIPVAWVALAAGVTLSAVAWQFTEAQVERAARAKFDAEVADARSTIQASLRGHYDVLHAVQGLFLVTPFLLKHGCDEMQGYYFSKPLPLEQVTSLILQEKQARRSSA